MYGFQAIQLSMNDCYLSYTNFFLNFINLCKYEKYFDGSVTIVLYLTYWEISRFSY